MSDKGWFVMGKLKSKKRGLPNMRGSHTLVKIKIPLIDIFHITKIDICKN